MSSEYLETAPGEKAKKKNKYLLIRPTRKVSVIGETNFTEVSYCSWMPRELGDFRCHSTTKELLVLIKANSALTATNLIWAKLSDLPWPYSFQGVSLDPPFIKLCRKSSTSTVLSENFQVQCTPCSRFLDIFIIFLKYQHIPPFLSKLFCRVTILKW